MASGWMEIVFYDARNFHAASDAHVSKDYLQGANSGFLYRNL